MKDAMNFELLTKLECPCGSRHFHIESIAARPAPEPPGISSVLCDEWCAFLRCPIASGRVSPADCRACRSLDIAEGKAVCECGLAWRVHQGLPEFGDRAVPEQPGDGLKVVETDFDKDPRWNRFVNAHPEGTVFHHSLWLQALKAEFKQQTLSLACLDENGAFQGILPLFYTRGLPLRIGQLGRHHVGRRLCSLPRTPAAGPLCSTPVITRFLLQEAVRRVESRPGMVLQLKTGSNHVDGLVRNMAGEPWRESYTLELPASSTEGVRFGNARQNHRITWAVNRARRLGIVTREASCEGDLKQWYQLYLETMRRVVAPARPYALFLHMWNTLRPRSMMRLLLAEKSEDRPALPLAGSIFLMHGRSTVYAFTGCRTEAMALHVNDLLQWEAIQRAYREGFRIYDFGEVVEERQGLAAFKSKWCAKPAPLYRYYYPMVEEIPAKSPLVSGMPELAARLWQRLPLSVTAFLGRRLYSHL